MRQLSTRDQNDTDINNYRSTMSTIYIPLINFTSAN